MESNYKSNVALQIVLGIVLGVALWLVLFWWWPSAATDRLQAIGYGLLVACLPLVGALQLVLFERFNSSELIKGRAESEPMSIRRAFLDNTVEQTLLVAIALCCGAALLPITWLTAIYATSGVFIVGRLLFYLGYANNPMRRFVGFVMGHYASLGLLGLSAYFSVLNW